MLENAESVCVYFEGETLLWRPGEATLCCLARVGVRFRVRVVPLYAAPGSCCVLLLLDPIACLAWLVSLGLLSPGSHLPTESGEISSPTRCLSICLQAGATLCRMKAGGGVACGRETRVAEAEGSGSATWVTLSAPNPALVCTPAMRLDFFCRGGSGLLRRVAPCSYDGREAESQRQRQREGQQAVGQRAKGQAMTAEKDGNDAQHARNPHPATHRAGRRGASDPMPPKPDGRLAPS